MCELIGRVDADPDVLPRTENFGLDYIAFSAMCPSCPPDFLKLTYNCVKVRIFHYFYHLKIHQVFSQVAIMVSGLYVKFC